MEAVKKLSIKDTPEMTTDELNALNAKREEEYIKKQLEHYVPVKNELKFIPELDPNQTRAKFDTAMITFNDQGSVYWYKQKFPYFPNEYYNIFAHYTNGTLKKYIQQRKKEEKKWSKDMAKKDAKKQGKRLKKKDIHGIKIRREQFTVTWD